MIVKKAQAGQENFRLVLESEIDFTANVPSAITIQYWAPGASTVAEWDATALVGSETDGKVKHDFGTGANAVPAAGSYKVRIKMTISAKIVYTKPQMWIVGGF